ncbi:hypothetical protein [Phormidium nigroviride]|uniref:hypothetical protein n=1 Tax=Phormidium nigroviride TaxID=482564 RepID=UPI0003122BCD
MFQFEFVLVRVPDVCQPAKPFRPRILLDFGDRLAYLETLFGSRLEYLYSSPLQIEAVPMLIC